MRTYTILSALTICLLTLHTIQADQEIPNIIILPSNPASATQNNANPAQEVRANMQRWRDAIMSLPSNAPLRQHLAARLESLNNGAHDQNN